MEQLVSFVAHHWFLWSLFALILATLLWLEVYEKGGAKNIIPSQAVQMMNHDDAVVIDLRDNDSFKENHIRGSQNVPADQVEKRLGKLQKYKNQAVVLVCASNMQTAKTRKLLQQNGFAKVYNLQGGLNAWRAAKLPIAKGE